MKSVQTTLERNWSMYNLAQTKEKLLFMKILNEAVDSLDIQEKKQTWRGHPKLKTSDLLKCINIKVFNNFSCLRTIPDLHMAKGYGYIQSIPHFNTLSNYMKSSTITPYLEKLYMILALPFKDIEVLFAIDSSGFGKYCTSWLRVKEEKKKWNSFNKLHLVCGCLTNVVARVTITKATEHDVLHFPRLLKETSKIFTVKEIYGDKGYLSLENVNVAHEVGATPFIMPKKNTRLASKKPWKKTEAWDRMVSYFRCYPEEFKSHYFKRNNVESTFSSIKAKFLPYVRSKDPIAQKNEILCKVVCHNASMLIRGIFQHGVTPDFSN